MKHPRDIDWDAPITPTDFGYFVDADDPYIHRLINRGVLPRGATALQWFQLYSKHMRLKAAGRSADSSLSDERAELTKVQREIAEIQLLVKRAEYAPVSVVSRQVARSISTASAMLASIPREVVKHDPTVTQATLKVIQRVTAAACDAAVEAAVAALPLEEDEEESAA